jgi:hypothetical protein
MPLEPTGSPQATAPPPDGVRSADPYAGLWRRFRRQKLLDPLTTDPAEGRREIEIDFIVASRAEWDACLERLEDGWDPAEKDGVVLAERTVG